MSFGFTRSEVDDLTIDQMNAYMKAIAGQQKQLSLRLIQAAVFPNMKDKARKDTLKELQE